MQTNNDHLGLFSHVSVHRIHGCSLNFIFYLRKSEVLVNRGRTGRKTFLVYCFTLNTLFFPQQAIPIDSIFLSLVGKAY